jgi:hypothetical protein
MNIAVLTTRLFDQPRSGGELCTARLLSEILDAGHQVLLIGRGHVPATGLPGVRYVSVGPWVTPFEELSTPQRIASLCAALLSGQASTVQRLAHGGVAQQVRHHLQSTGPEIDVLVLDHLQVLPWLAALRGELPPLWLVMHNLEAQNYVELARQAGGRGQRWRQRVLQREARRLRDLECQALSRAAVVACLSAQDAAQLKLTAAACGSRARLEVLPSFPLELHPRLGATLAPRPGPVRRIGMIGTWTWEPNRLGLRWVLDCVLPHLPGPWVLVLAGPGLEGTALPRRVEWLGRVPSAASFYSSVDVVALASHVGSGVQEKAVEAIAAARLVVATPHSVRGLQWELPDHVWVTGDAQEFASLCATAPVQEEPAWASAVRKWRESRRRRYAEVLGRCLKASH